MSNLSLIKVIGNPELELIMTLADRSLTRHMFFRPLEHFHYWMPYLYRINTRITKEVKEPQVMTFYIMKKRRTIYMQTILTSFPFCPYETRTTMQRTTFNPEKFI